jgi:Flp pilus assembly pilin Flp
MMLRREEAQDSVEYGLLIAIVAIVILLAVFSFGDQIHEWFLRLSVQVTTR